MNPSVEHHIKYKLTKEKITQSTRRIELSLRNKLAIGGKILSCNLTKIDRYNFPVNGLCSLHDCSYEEFEKRLLEIYSMPKENYFSKINVKPDYLDKFSKNYATINLIRKKLSQLGVNQN